MTDIEKAIILLVENGYRVEKIPTNLTHTVNIESVSQAHFEILKQPVTILGLTERTLKCLNDEGIFLVLELISLTDGELLHVPNLGRKSLNELKEKLAVRGLFLKNVRVQSNGEINGTTN